MINNINAYKATRTSETLGPTVPTATTLYPTKSYESGSSIVFNNSAITFDAQNDSNAYFFITAVEAITFTNVPSITLINGAQSSHIFWRAGSAITTTGTSPATIPGILIAYSSINFANGLMVVGRLYAQTASITFNGDGNFTVNGTPPPQIIVCYAKGTLLLTTRGLIPIERLRVGQELVSKGELSKHQLNPYPGVELVKWVSKFKVSELNSESRPICIEKNALGKNQPFKDLYVSPAHSILVNGQMVLAKRLVNGVNIYPDRHAEEVTYYHVECNRHCAIIANGVAAESYLESNNRHVFDNKTNPPKISSFLSNYVNKSFIK